MKHTPFLALLSLASQTFADLCNCGYSINHTDSMQFGLFTELEETDFFHTSSVDNTVRIGTTRWDAQVYNKSAEQVGRLLGFSKQLGNVIANPLQEGIWGGPPASIGDAGLQLWVRHALEDGLVPIAGIDDAFNPKDTSHMIYGSFRAAIKFSGMNGTRGAFSWQSASEERRQYIGIEFASSETDTIQVVAYDRPAANGSDSTDEVSGSDESEATATGATRWGSSWTSVVDFPQEFHEFRFDWLPDRVDFYVDGQLTITQTESVPDTPGTLALRHFEDNGRAEPPAQDAVMTVGYVKAYYNATTRDQPKSRCHRLEGNVCIVPDQNSPPNPVRKTFFFSQGLNEEEDDGKSRDDDLSTNGVGWDFNHDNSAAAFGTGLLLASFVLILACGLL